MASSCLDVDTKSSEAMVLPLLLGSDSMEELREESADLRSFSKSGLCNMSSIRTPADTELAISKA